MSAFDLVVVILGLVSCFELILAIVIRHQRMKLEHRIRIEQARGEFAAARVGLNRLALDGKTDSMGKEFLSLNQSFTFVMRRPEQYLEIGKLLEAAMLENFQQQGVGQTRPMNEAMIPIYRQMLAGTALLLVDASFVSRHFVSWSEREKLKKEPEKFFLGLKAFVQFLVKLEGRMKPGVMALNDVKGGLEKAMAPA